MAAAVPGQRAPASPPGEPWLPVVADAECLCVEAQEKDPASTLAFVRSLLWLRAREPTLQSGTQIPVSV